MIGSRRFFILLASVCSKRMQRGKACWEEILIGKGVVSDANAVVVGEGIEANVQKKISKPKDEDSKSMQTSRRFRGRKFFLEAEEKTTVFFEERNWPEDEVGQNDEKR